MSVPKPVVLCILDGWGKRADTTGNATALANTPNVDRVMFRHDPGTPSPSGTALEGLGLLDNIRAVPEPSSAVLLCSIGFLWLRRRR